MARRKHGKRRSYRGLGNPFKVYSSYGKLNLTLGSVLPPLVGGAGALGATLLLRAFVPPDSKDASGVPIVENGKPKLNPFWKYAGLMGGGIGAVASLILGPFMGWGASLVGVVTSVAAGATAQFVNAVVPEDKRMLAQYGRYGMVFAKPRPHYQGLGARSPKFLTGMRGMGQVAATEMTGRKYYKPGREGMSPEVLNAVNMTAFGHGNTTGAGF